MSESERAWIQERKRLELYDFKAKYLSKLALLKATTPRENELRNHLVRTLTKLRLTTFPNFLMLLNDIINKEEVSQEFKEICMEIVRDIEKMQSRWGS